jgi:transposase
MRGIKATVPVYLWLGRCDMRMSFDRLSGLVKEKMARSVIEGGLYVFFSRDRARVKILYWDRDGYALWHKRLEAGMFRVELRDGHEAITGVDLEEILCGVDLSRIKVRKSAENGLYL